uniref:Uncharacterized protein n=1 Tax=Anopheles atroparvus TaxID=41427 RepID=A0A182J9Z8_ANOAO
MIVTGLLLAGLFYHNPLATVPVVAILGLLYWLVKYNYRFWEIDGVPFPKPSMLVGNLGPTLMLKKHISQLADGWYNAFPNATFVGYFKLFTPAIMVRDPELVKNILTRDFDCFATNDIVVDSAQDPLLVHDAFLATGERWKRSRALLTPSFTGAKIKQLFPTMNSVGDAFQAFVGQHVSKEVEAKELANSPDVQEKLFQEIKKQIDANDGNLDYDVLQKIEYLDWVMLETLRMHPPAATMLKLSTKKYIMRRGERDSQGHDLGIYVREGTPILIPVLAIHMDPKYYPEPQKFDPERFSPDRKVEYRGTVFMPFGEGPRMCLGMRFGQAQVKLALVKLILNYRVNIGPNHKPFCVDPRSMVYQSKHGIRVVFEKR